jgi:hypothetical protein
VAMDGGSSTGLYFHGQMVVRPARALTNSLVIYADRVRYQRARRTFLGRSLPRTTARPPSSASPAIAIQMQPAAEGKTPDSSAAADRLPIMQPLAPSTTAPPPPAASAAGADQALPAASPRGVVRQSPQETTSPPANPTDEAAAKPGKAVHPAAPGPG